MEELPSDWPHDAAGLVTYVVDRNYGGVRKRLAESMNLSLSYLGKVVNHGWPLGPGSALQLAQLGGLSPDYCLRICGHSGLLDLILEGFGHGRMTRAVALDDHQRQLLAVFALLTDAQQAALLGFLQTIRSVRD